MKMLDYEMKKTDDLLYRMIPKPVAKRLRKGEPAVNTCEVRLPHTSLAILAYDLKQQKQQIQCGLFILQLA